MNHSPPHANTNYLHLVRKICWTCRITASCVLHGPTSCALQSWFIHLGRKHTREQLPPWRTITMSLLFNNSKSTSFFFPWERVKKPEVGIIIIIIIFISARFHTIYETVTPRCTYPPHTGSRLNRQQAAREAVLIRQSACMEGTIRISLKVRRGKDRITAKSATRHYLQ